MKSRLVLGITTVVMACFINVSIGQNVEFTKKNFPSQKKELKVAKKNIRKGLEWMNKSENEYSGLQQANKYFELANQFNPNNADLNFKIVYCYMKGRLDKTKSIAYLEKARALDSNVDPELLYYLGKAYHYNNEFDKAQECYKSYIEKGNGVNLRDAELRYMECNNAPKLVENKEEVVFSNLGEGINGIYDEYTTTFTMSGNMLYFTSKRPTLGKSLSQEGNYYEAVYSASYDDIAGKWSSANLVKGLNKKNQHTAIQAISADGNTVWIYRSKSAKKNDLYEVKKKPNGKWGKPKKIDAFVKSDAHNTSISVTGDGNTMYFVSERSGGFGEHDVYKMEKQGKSWGEPINLGTNINTTYDEAAVFVSSDGNTLFFSSRGHNSMGGYDIFRSDLVNGEWSKPENLGYPINTADDDVFFMKLYEEGQKAKMFVSSSKDGGYGGMDIYQIEYDEGYKATLKGLISEEMKVDSGAIIVKVRDLANNEVVKKSEVEPDGSYTIKGIRGNKNYRIEVTKDGYEDLVEDFEVPELTDEKVYVRDYRFTDANKVMQWVGVIVDGTTGAPIPNANIRMINKADNSVYRDVFADEKGQYKAKMRVGDYELLIGASSYYPKTEYATATAADMGKTYTEKNFELLRSKGGKSFMLDNIYFDYNEYTLRTASIETLGELADMMKTYPKMKVKIMGHCDIKGSNMTNIELSKNRVYAAKQYLEDKGIEADRLEAAWFSFKRPATSNETDEGRQVNRRTEFRVMSIY